MQMATSGDSDHMILLFNNTIIIEKQYHMIWIARIQLDAPLKKYAHKITSLYKEKYLIE